MNDDESLTSPHRNVTRLALLVELGLGVVAIVLAYLLNRWPIAGFHLTSLSTWSNFEAVLFGLGAVFPMLLMLLGFQYVPWGPVANLRRVVDDLLVPLFRGTTVAQMALISLAAGLGEELFFRGLMQATIEDAIGVPLGPWAGLLIASAVFGVCHWLTHTYAVLATFIGVYLGAVFQVTGNLWAPITTHAVYDFIALLYLVRWRKGNAPVTTPERAEPPYAEQEENSTEGRTAGD